jgi:curved DNA-binding protein CbpA
MLSQPLRSPYDVLHVPRDASAGKIQRAYRELARRYHPDVNRGRDARARFQELSDAYDVLRDPRLRARYDRSTTEPIAHARPDRVRAPTFTVPRPQPDVPRFLDEDPPTVLHEGPRAQVSVLRVGVFGARVTVAWRWW